MSDYWRRLWGWYDAGGLRHVAAYLSELDLSGFDPAAPPPKTPAFWDIADAGRAPEDAEIADVLDALKRPDAVTLARIREKADVSLTEWLSDRRNRRAIPHRLEACGYTPVRNPATPAATGSGGSETYARWSTPRPSCRPRAPPGCPAPGRDRQAM